MITKVMMITDPNCSVCNESKDEIKTWCESQIPSPEFTVVDGTKIEESLRPIGYPTWRLFEGETQAVFRYGGGGLEQFKKHYEAFDKYVDENMK